MISFDGRLNQGGLGIRSIEMAYKVRKVVVDGGEPRSGLWRHSSKF